MARSLDSLKKMNRAELLRLSTGKFDDYDFVNLAEYFSEEHEDRDREVAALELALRSPMVDEMVDYTQLYLDVVGYYLWKGEIETALRWAVTFVAFTAQHDLDNLLAAWRDLGSTYLEVGQPEVGLAIFARLIERNPGDIWNYNSMGLVLSRVKLNQLAIDVAGHGLEILAKHDKDGLRSQFKGFVKDAQALLANGVDETDQISTDVLNALRAAMALPVGSEFDDDAEVGHLPPVDDLLDLDEEEDEERYQEILEHGKVLIPELIYLGLDRNWVNESAGPLHAARLLNRLRAGQAPELDGLASWLDHLPIAGERFWLGSSLGKTGGYTLDELDAIARNSGFNQQMRDMAVEEMVNRVKEDERLRAGVVELVRDLLNREGSDHTNEEGFTALLIGSALDLKERELLPDMERAFADDRVDRHIIDEYDMYHKLDLLIPPMPERRSDGLYLGLECKACGRVREHFTHFVVLNILDDGDNPRQRSPYVLDHQVICPKCGAVDQYEMPGIEMIKLMDLSLEELTHLISQKPAKTPPKYGPLVYTLRGTAMGKMMHVLDGIDEYRNRITMQPNHAELHMRLGNLLRTIGRYPQALEEYRQAVAIDGKNLDILFPAATAEHDFGDQETAKLLYERILKTGQIGLRALLKGIDEQIIATMRSMEALRRGEISFWAYQVSNMQGDLLLPPRFGKMGKPGKTEKKSKPPRRRGKKR